MSRESLTKKFLFVSILFSIMLLFNMQSFVVHHEAAHAQVLTQMGYDNVTVNYGFLRLSGTTKAQFTEGAHHEDARFLNAFAEVFGYHVNIMVETAWLITFFVVVVVFLLYDERRDRCEENMQIRRQEY